MWNGGFRLEERTSAFKEASANWGQLEYDESIRWLIDNGMSEAVVQNLMAASESTIDSYEWLAGIADIVGDFFKAVDMGKMFKNDIQLLSHSEQKEYFTQKARTQKNAINRIYKEMIVAILTITEYDLGLSVRDDAAKTAPSLDLDALDVEYAKKLSVAMIDWWNFNLLAFLMMCTLTLIEFPSMGENIRSWSKTYKSKLLKGDWKFLQNAIRAMLSPMRQNNDKNVAIREVAKSSGTQLNDMNEMTKKVIGWYKRLINDLADLPVSFSEVLFDDFEKIASEDVGRLIEELTIDVEEIPLLGSGKTGELRRAFAEKTNTIRNKDDVDQRKILSLLLLNRDVWQGDVLRSVVLRKGNKHPYYCAVFTKNDRLFVIAECAKNGNATYIFVSDDLSAPWQDILHDKQSAREYGVLKINHSKKRDHWGYILSLLNQWLIESERLRW